MKLFVAVLACLALAACAERVTMFSTSDVPSDWSVTGFANEASTEDARFLFALKQRNLEQLESLFWEVSNPKSAQYTNYLSRDEILAMVAPEQSAVNSVVAWMRATGVKEIFNYGDSIEIITSVNVASQLFATPFHQLSHADGRSILRSISGYSLPAEIAQHVDFVTGVSSFPIDHSARKRQAVKEGQATTVPQTLRALYQIPEDAKVHASNVSQTVVEFQSGQSFMPTDLQSFASNVGQSIAAVTPNHIVGDYQPAAPGDECTLDIEYISAMGNGAVNWWWQDNYWVYDWTVSFGSKNDIPLVASISYGWAEDDQCQFGQCSKLGVDATQYVQRTNVEFQKIGLRGVSVLIASGDSGANGRSDPYCTSKQLKPTYPGASPYVTTVGATEVRSPEFNLANPPPVCQSMSCISGGIEAAVSYSQSHFASGGGFSDIAPQPAYQKAAVAVFLQNSTAFPAEAGAFNKAGRGYPDVAALGSAIFITFGGQNTLVGGTSASTPEWAGIVTLFNAARIESGKKALGFLNQALYQAPDAAFNDITEGNNKCTENGCGLFGSCKGFDATVAWDPVTGLGSPNFPNMKSYLLSLA